MKNLVISIGVFLFISLNGATAHQRWVATYWCNWNQSPANLQELLNQNAFTHIIHFAVGLNADGTIPDDNSVHTLSVQAPQVVSACHAVGVKAIICIFPGSQGNITSAFGPSTRATTVHNICNLMRTYGYDGVDWDIEVGLDTSAWNPGMHVLRDSLNAVGVQLGRPLTNSVWTYGGSPWVQYRGSARYFDRIHIEGYEQTGAYQGWIVWNGYGIYTGGYHLPCYPAISVAGVDSTWAGWLRSGVPDSVLLFSQSCSGRTWTGGTMVANILGYPATGNNGALHPGDVWTGSWPPDCGSYNGMPTVSGYEFPYADIVNGAMSAYPTLHDTIVMAAYKSVDNPGNANDTYLPFPDPWTWWHDWYYMAHVRNGGGMSMWDAWRGRVASNNFPLIDALKLSIANIPLSPAPTGTFAITPDTLPAGGGQITLVWTSQNATSTIISPAVGSVSANGSMNLNVSSSMTFIFTVSNTTAEVQYAAHVGVASSGGGTSNIVTDNFNRPNASTLGAGWAVPTGKSSCIITNAYYDSTGHPCVPNNCGLASGGGFSYRIETFSNDQYTEITPVSSLAGYRYIYAGVRMGGANGEGYYAKTDGVQTYIVKINSSGVETILQSLPSVSWTEYGHDRMKIQVVGNVINVFKNGIQVSLDQIDNSIAGGHPGIALQPDNNTALDNFEGGGLLVGGQGHQDITVQALSPIALITQPTGNGSRNIEVIRDGFTPPVGSSDASLQYDTYDGGGARTFDWIGYQFASQHTFASMVFQEGMQFTDGGWFTLLGVQVRVSGQWVDVQNMQSTPPYAGANGINYESYELSFTPISGDGIRIAGTPGGSAHYVSVGELRVFDNGTSGITPNPLAPRDFALLQNYPNPFNPSTKISFNLPVGANVTIKVYNVLGQEISTLADGPYAAGRYSVDFSGDRLPNGIYFYAIKAGSFSEMKKMVLLK